MAESKQVVDFSGGMNNLARVDSLPAGTVRSASNFDPVNGGAMSLRTGYALQEAVADLRGAVAVGDDIIMVAADIRRFSTAAGYSTSLGAAPVGDGVVGAALNGDAFLQVGVTQLRVRGNTVAQWALPEVTPQVSFVTGALPAGVYRVAVTAVDVFGAESGATPLIFTIGTPCAVQLNWVSPPGTVEARVYVSATDGETLYLQGAAAGSYLVTSPLDSGARLTTMNMQPPPLASYIAEYKGRLVLAAANVLWYTEPFAPHLVNYISGHVSFGGDVVMVQPVDGGVYVATAERTVFITDLGLEGQRSQTLAEFGAVPGSQVLLPDGRAAWLTQYGQAFGTNQGVLALPQRISYAPIIASAASAGVVENNGVQMLVTNLKGAVNPNTLGVVDSFDLEID